jgi:uncharacterized protein (TIGR02452 family)
MTLDRSQLIRDAEATVQVLERGEYDGPAGRSDLRPHLTRMQASTRLYTPEQLQALDSFSQPSRQSTQISVTRETTLATAQRLQRERAEPVSVLNFASATSLGGGFLTGSAAQEESLCRASGLSASLQLHPEYYGLHRQQSSRLYTDHLMFAQDVPVFREETGAWLAEPYHLDVLTAAAPNLRGLQGEALEQLKPLAQQTLERRAALVLALFRHTRCTRLVLGAWGCGAFRNDPEQVAATFDALLSGRYAGVFTEVVFAVFAMPWEETNLRVFQSTFHSGITSARL